MEIFILCQFSSSNGLLNLAMCMHMFSFHRFALERFSLPNYSWDPDKHSSPHLQSRAVEMYPSSPHFSYTVLRKETHPDNAFLQSPFKMKVFLPSADTEAKRKKWCLNYWHSARVNCVCVVTTPNWEHRKQSDVSDILCLVNSYSCTNVQEDNGDQEFSLSSSEWVICHISNCCLAQFDSLIFFLKQLYTRVQALLLTSCKQQKNLKLSNFTLYFRCVTIYIDFFDIFCS